METPQVTPHCRLRGAARGVSRGCAARPGRWTIDRGGRGQTTRGGGAARPGGRSTASAADTSTAPANTGRAHDRRNRFAAATDYAANMQPSFQRRMRTQADTEATIAGLAARQHGVVSRRQLLEAGIGPDVVDRRLQVKRLTLLHRGVYLVGPLMPPHAHLMAAVLACGVSAAVSHQSAAALWNLIPVRRLKAVDVIVPRGRRHRRSGIRVRRLTLLPDEVTELHGIPVTTAARTVCDLAATGCGRELERALADALGRRLTSRSQLDAMLARQGRRPGMGRLKALLTCGEQPARTRSEAEESFLALVRKAQLPHPRVNGRVCGYELDFFWPKQRFAVEVDGYEFHSSRRSFERDRRRDGELAAVGVRVVRVTWRQIVREPEALLVRLAQALARTPAVEPGE